MNPIAEAAECVGKTGQLAIFHKDKGSQMPISVPVEVQDSKFGYGRIRLLVAPVGGTGKWWVDISRVEFDK